MHLLVRVFFKTVRRIAHHLNRNSILQEALLKTKQFLDVYNSWKLYIQTLITNTVGILVSFYYGTLKRKLHVKGFGVEL